MINVFGRCKRLWIAYPLAVLLSALSAGADPGLGEARLDKSAGLMTALSSLRGQTLKRWATPAPRGTRPYRRSQPPWPLVFDIRRRGISLAGRDVQGPDTAGRTDSLAAGNPLRVALPVSVRSKEGQVSLADETPASRSESTLCLGTQLPAALPRLTVSLAHGQEARGRERIPRQERQDRPGGIERREALDYRAFWPDALSDLVEFRLQWEWTSYLRQGTEGLKAGEYGKAANWLTRARLLAPERFEPMFGLVISYVGTGDYNQAAVLVGQIARRWPNLLLSRQVLSNFYESRETAQEHAALLRKRLETQGQKSNLRLLWVLYQWYFGKKQIAAADIRWLASQMGPDSAAAALAKAINVAIVSEKDELADRSRGVQRIPLLALEAAVGPTRLTKRSDRALVLAYELQELSKRSTEPTTTHLELIYAIESSEIVKPIR